jgi:hypothetical protein
MQFKILKIKNKESFYILYAQRNDSIFKIFSSKNISSEYCEKIKKNGLYNLSLKKILPPDSILGIPYHSNLGVRTEWDKYIKKKYHYRVYNANNLDGLCIQQ